MAGVVGASEPARSRPAPAPRAVRRVMPSHMPVQRRKLGCVPALRGSFSRTMDIHQVSWDDTEAVRRFVAVNQAVRDHEEPWAHPHTVDGTALSMRYGWDGE